MWRKKEDSYTIKAVLDLKTPGGITVHWTAPSHHSPCDFVALFYDDVKLKEAIMTRRLESGAAQGSMVLTVGDGFPDVWATWPYEQFRYILRLLTYAEKRSGEACVAECTLQFDENERQAELRRLDDVDKAYEARMTRQEGEDEKGGLKVKCTLLTDSVAIDPSQWNHHVRFYAIFTNMRQTPITLNLRDVHGIGSGRLNLRYVAPLTSIGPGGCPVPPGPSPPPGPNAMGPVFTLPPAPKRFRGKEGLIVLSPGEIFEHRFYLVSPFYQPPPAGKYCLEFIHTQPTYQGVDDEDRGTQWDGSLKCSFIFECTGVPNQMADGNV